MWPSTSDSSSSRAAEKKYLTGEKNIYFLGSHSAPFFLLSLKTKDNLRFPLNTETSIIIYYCHHYDLEQTKYCTEQ